MWDAVLDLVPSDTPPALAVTALMAAVVVIGIAKSGFGGGVGILAVPLVAVALEPKNALGVTLPILIAADVVAVWLHRRQRSGTHLRWLLAGGVVGILIATVLMWVFREFSILNTALNLTVGGICLLFVALQLYRLLGGRVPSVPPTANAGRVTGTVAGVTSTLAHAAGPVVTIYLLEQRLEKQVLVGTLVLYFFVLNLAKLPSYVGLGYVNGSTLAAALVVLPLVPVGSLLGFWLHRHIPERPFTIIMYLGAAAAGAWMIVKSVT